MNWKVFTPLIMVFFSCSQKVDVTKINDINGYWQIQKVEDADNHKKEYKINEVYDFFEVKNNTGFHKKVTWQPDGTFLVNDLQDVVKVMIKENKVTLNFKSKFGSHEEELITISEDKMILKSKEQVSFYYTKVNPDKKINVKTNK